MAKKKSRPYSKVEVSTVGSNVYGHSFIGEQKALMAVIKKVGIDVDDEDEIHIERGGKFLRVKAKDRWTQTVLNGDTVFIVPPISGGAN